MKRKIAVAVFPMFAVSLHAFTLLAAQETLCSDDVSLHVSVDTIDVKAEEGGTLCEVVVDGNSSNKQVQMRSALNTIGVNKKFIEENFSGSLMQTLSRLPGVKSMNVGSGESKPIIRGLGFNRVVVTDNGIKHEGQQWGDDHGLETDQFVTENVEVVKGPAALMYGSDAVGGVINLRSDAIPHSRFSGKANVFAHTNNEALGVHVGIKGRNGRFWYKAGGTIIDYADYKIPADSIQYYSYFIKLKDRRLRNTAGREFDGNIMLGYVSEHFHSYFRFSDVNVKSGYFADAHGLEVRLSGIDYDSSRRDIDLPYHSVNHFIVSNHSELIWDGGQIESNIAYQNNRQREFAESVSHGYMPIPPNTLERSFNKYTLSGNVNMRTRINSHTLRMGVSAEYQANRIGGWGFILPEFEQLALGAYLSDRFIVGDNTVLSAGIRYDYGNINIHSYRDWYATPANDGSSTYIERSAELGKHFNSVTWSLGVNHILGDWVLKANVGKSFRMPIAKELGMDGINYNIFRYEKGNSFLKAEQSYQIDAGIVYEHGVLSANITPYFNYFPNYIYLNPTAGYREGLQLYHYTQSRVMRWGFEAELNYSISKKVAVSAVGEYLYSRQLSGDKKGYTLPFSTPWSTRFEMKYLLGKNDYDNGYLSLEWVIVGAQNEIVPPEEATPGYQLLNVNFMKTFAMGGSKLKLTLSGENLLNRKYYDHTSYYRLIGVPEPGRNFSLMVGWEF